MGVWVLWIASQIGSGIQILCGMLLSVERKINQNNVWNHIPKLQQRTGTTCQKKWCNPESEEAKKLNSLFNLFLSVSHSQTKNLIRPSNRPLMTRETSPGQCHTDPQ